MKVHILHEGFPLCDFSRIPPVDWPTGHQWVSLHDRDKGTCSACREKAKQMLNKNPPKESETRQ